MKPSEVASALGVLIDTKRAAFIWGPPGVGKSDIVGQVAAGLGRKLVDIRAVLLDPVDLRGLPRLSDEGLTEWCAPNFLPTEGEGILFLDELNAAPQAVQTACYQLVLDRCLGDYRLPDGWAVLAAGNRETDRANAGRMPSALANRFAHISFDVDIDDWCAWAFNAGVRPEIIAFLRFRQELLHDFNADQKAFPTPRSWKIVSDVMTAVPDGSIERELYAGVVGEGAAAELMSFLQVYRDLPSPDAIILDPVGSAVPEGIATLYAIATVLARKAAPENFDSIATYAARLPAEYSVFLVKSALIRRPDCQHTEGFTRWAAKNGALLT